MGVEELEADRREDVARRQDIRAAYRERYRQLAREAYTQLREAHVRSAMFHVDGDLYSVNIVGRRAQLTTVADEDYTTSAEYSRGIRALEALINGNVTKWEPIMFDPLVRIDPESGKVTPRKLGLRKRLWAWAMDKLGALWNWWVK